MEDQRFLTFHSPPPISGAQFFNGSTYDDVQAFEWLGLIPKNLTDDHKIGPWDILGMEDFWSVKTGPRPGYIYKYLCASETPLFSVP